MLIYDTNPFTFYYGEIIKLIEGIKQIKVFT